MGESFVMYYPQLKMMNGVGNLNPGGNMQDPKMNKLIIIVLSILASFGVFHLFNQYFGLSNDNPVEQAIEEVIEDETGVDLDLTPDSYANRLDQLKEIK